LEGVLELGALFMIMISYGNGYFSAAPDSNRAGQVRVGSSRFRSNVGMREIGEWMGLEMENNRVVDNPDNKKAP
jgi:hypothetical protein